MLTDVFKQYSATRIQQGLHRRRAVGGNAGMISFSSNDYLSLASDARIKKAYQRGFSRYPCGSGGSMMVCGYHAIHQTLERAFADALKVDHCVLFPSGYAANVSVICLLAHFNVHVLLDKGMHASVYDGLKGAYVRYSRYVHNNLDDLAIKMKGIPRHSALMTEGIFSMSGQRAPLSDIAALCRHQHNLLVDEAHAFGVIGREGLGAVVQHGLCQKDVPLRIIPLGKAFAACGAIIAGHDAWIDALLQLARPFVYSTALSPAFTYGLLETLTVVQEADARRLKLAKLIGYFRDWVSRSPLTWRASDSLIQQLQLGCPHRALYYAEKLREQSILCLPMRQPTVSKEETGLRIILNYHHEAEHIDSLFECLHRL